MADAPQSFENHAKIVPVFHYVVLPLSLIVLLWSLYGLVADFSAGAVFSVVVAVLLILIGFFARGFALGVQDRVIRLEEHLRLARLSPDLAPRLEAITINQVCALRFASDGEAPALARKVLDEGFDDRKAIKRMVTSWRADHARI
jgi:hypothetical protein